MLPHQDQIYDALRFVILLCRKEIFPWRNLWSSVNYFLSSLLVWDQWLRKPWSLSLVSKCGEHSHQGLSHRIYWGMWWRYVSLLVIPYFVKSKIQSNVPYSIVLCAFKEEKMPPTRLWHYAKLLLIVRRFSVSEMLKCVFWSWWSILFIFSSLKTFGFLIAIKHNLYAYTEVHINSFKIN